MEIPPQNQNEDKLRRDELQHMLVITINLWATPVGLDHSIISIKAGTMITVDDVDRHVLAQVNLILGTFN